MSHVHRQIRTLRKITTALCICAFSKKMIALKETHDIDATITFDISLETRRFFSCEM